MKKGKILSQSYWRQWYSRNKERLRPKLNKAQNLSRRANQKAYNIYQRELRAKNPKHEAKKRKKYYITRRTLIYQFKNKPCFDCKKKYPPYVMDFDHVRGVKKLEISKASGWSKAKVLSEIKKCEVVCANCHRIRTHLRKAA